MFGFDCRRVPPGRSGRWSLLTASRALGLDGRILLEGEESCPPADSIEQTLGRIAALDLHLFPHHFANLEPHALAGCAMGIPTITTRFGAAEELLASHARLIEPRELLLHSDGSWTAAIDEARVVEELLALANDADARADLGTSGRHVLRTMASEAVARQWQTHIARLAA